MVVYGSVDRAYMGNMGLISTVITMVSHIVVLLLYWFIFRRDLQGFFNARRFGEFVLLGWSVPAVYVLLMSDELIKVPITLIRYRSFKWLKDVTRDNV